MIKSEITFGSSTTCLGPYLLHKTIFTQNGFLRNFRLEVIKILVLLCWQFTVCTDIDYIEISIKI